MPHLLGADDPACIWDDDGALSDVINAMDLNLMESIETCGYGLPTKPNPDASGVAWL